MNRHHLVLFLERGKELAAPALSTAPTRLAWVGVYPLDPSSSDTAAFLRNQGIGLLPTRKAAPIKGCFEDRDRSVILECAMRAHFERQVRRPKRPLDQIRYSW